MTEKKSIPLESFVRFLFGWNGLNALIQFKTYEKNNHEQKKTPNASLFCRMFVILRILNLQINFNRIFDHSFFTEVIY